MPHLEFELLALGVVGVGAADDEVAGLLLGEDPDVVLAHLVRPALHVAVLLGLSARVPFYFLHTNGHVINTTMVP